MSLSASMYAGTSGLKAHGEKMSVIVNNISNVSTIGFKASRMYFEDAMSQHIATASGGGQVGRGVAIGAVMGDFSQGSLETTSEATDLAVGGNGFFVVSPPGQEVNYYTRAGNFRFNEEGYLVDPHQYRVQGWPVLQESSSVASTGEKTAQASTGVKIAGVPQDIKLDNFQSPPQATSRVDMILNVDSQSEDKTTGKAGPAGEGDPKPDKPFTALFNAYDSTQKPPLGEKKYAYQSPIKVYDENGASHTLTVYMDPINDPNLTKEAGGKRHWEYIIAVPKDEDNREFWSGTVEDAPMNQKMRGVLMAGTLTFNAAGELENMSAFTINNPYAEDSEPNPEDPTSRGTYRQVSDPLAWTPAHFSQNGYPVCTANFLGTEFGSMTKTETRPDPGGEDGTPNIPTILGENKSKNIEINFGLRNKATSWDWTIPEGVDATPRSLAVLDTTFPQYRPENPNSPTNEELERHATDVKNFLKGIPGLASIEKSALTTTEEASQALNEQLGQLRSHLESQGLKVSKLEVQTGLPDTQSESQWQGTHQHNRYQENREQALSAQRLRTLGRVEGNLAQEMQEAPHREKTSRDGLDLFA